MLEAELRAAVAYEAGLCRELRGGRQDGMGGTFAESAETARRCGSENGNGRGWCALYAEAEAEDGRVGSFWVRDCACGKGWCQGEERGNVRGRGLGLMSYPFNCQHHHFPFPNLN